MKKGSASMVCLSFDDGRADNYTTVWPLLRQKGVAATFNICTGYVLGDKACEHFTSVQPMTATMVREIFEDKTMEVAAHGYLHLSEAEDLQRGLCSLLDLLGTDRLTPSGNGMAVPHNRLSTAEHDALLPFMEERLVRYLRKSVRYGTHNHIGKWCRKMSRLISLNVLYRLGHADTLMDNALTKPIVYSVPILASTPPRCVESLTDMAISRGKHLVLQLHSIGGNDGALSYPTTAFNTLLEHLELRRQQGKIKIVTTMQMMEDLTR